MELKHFHDFSWLFPSMISFVFCFFLNYSPVFLIVVPSKLVLFSTFIISNLIPRPRFPFLLLLLLLIFFFILFPVSFTFYFHCNMFHPLCLLCTGLFSIIIHFLPINPFIFFLPLLFFYSFFSPFFFLFSLFSVAAPASKIFWGQRGGQEKNLGAKK